MRKLYENLNAAATPTPKKKPQVPNAATAKPQPQPKPEPQPKAQAKPDDFNPFKENNIGSRNHIGGRNWRSMRGRARKPFGDLTNQKRGES